MVAEFVAALARPVSNIRLENYRRDGSDLDMVVNYFFNVELSEALYPVLQAFEIALRNSIHSVLTSHFRTSLWFDHPDLLSKRQLDAVKGARGGLKRAGRSSDSDRIVAELHFGFWHSMFNKPFERELWRPDRSRLIGEVFPYVSNRQRTRQEIWDRCDRVRIIRNRVMHSEPIWSRPRLLQDHGEIRESLGWISTDMRSAISMCDRFEHFEHVYQTGRQDVERRIVARTGM